MGAKGEVVFVHTRLPPHGISSRIRESKVFSELIRFDLGRAKFSSPITIKSSKSKYDP